MWKRSGAGRTAVSMRLRAPARAPRVRFSRPGDGGGALHNCVAALRARSRPERPPRARHTRTHALRRALYVTRDHRARPRATTPRIRFRVQRDCVLRVRVPGCGGGHGTAGSDRRRAGRCRRSARARSLSGRVEAAAVAVAC